MLELHGKYNTAKVFNNKADNTAITQIYKLLDQSFVEGSKIRIMPDVHAGMGCTIGTTMTITDKIVPNLVGVDIGCGMETVQLKVKKIDLQKLDKAIRSYVPAGFSIRKKAHPYAGQIDLSLLRCKKDVNIERAVLSVGTLGGGNHFIELARNEHSEEDSLHLIVHSGSRNLGKQAAEYYQRLAVKLLKGTGIERSLSYLTGEDFDDYLHDMAIIQRYADINRKAMITEITNHFNLEAEDSFTTIHNYIDMETKILRKGAISAKKGERVLIPINMRDGSLICIGKGNDDWNQSAPHGAGRLMSRSIARAKISLSQFEASMQGIYSTTINLNTVDEAPFAYKSMEEIISNIGDTVDIAKKLKPIYNFKASE